jgi:hypothetical protein
MFYDSCGFLIRGQDYDETMSGGKKVMEFFFGKLNEKRVIDIDVKFWS